ncbi:hypothetical protein GL58_18765 [Comamonas testosteroni]|uniref:Uncharacterized protein n=1 Tax=Comamonas testosteroni TaxID=285 RepID=A0A0L7MBJ1_COMTE|nr:hypothetical protein [Comamonas testosteroni]KOC19249.1 hypothetical protein GL58_18765 [Comamonas testosteroni]
MLLIRPTKVTPAMVTASSAGAADPDYSATVSWALNSRVYLPANGKTYECVQAPALDKYPPTEPLYWKLAAPSNRWSMFDGEPSTSTVTAGDLTTTVVVPGRINAVALFGLVGSRLQITQRSVANTVLATFDKQLIRPPASWYEYFYRTSEQIPDAVFTGLVPSTGSKLEITIKGPAACAAIVVGNQFDLGNAKLGASTSIVDYSKKATSADGVQSFEPGRFSRRMSVVLEQPGERYPSVQRELEKVRATPCVWLGVPDVERYSPMTIYGFYRDFSLEVAYTTTNLCSLEIESLT